MLSFVQYRRIGAQVAAEHSRVRSDPALLEKRASAARSSGGDVERATDGRPPTGADDSGASAPETSEQEESDGKIWVRITGDDDPFDPRNWPLAARCKNIAVLSLLIFVQAWSGAAESGANQSASREFGVSKVAENLSTAMYLFGIASGSFFAGPLSETVGRNPVYLVSTFCYLFFVLGSALTPTFGGQVVCRYLVGVFASATLSINGSSVRDQFRPVKRAFVFPVIAWANVAAPVIAPIPAGWFASDPRLGWRWTEWLTLIISGVAWLIAVAFLPETYVPVLLDWKAKHLRRVTGNERYVSEHAESANFLQQLKKSAPLPLKFFRSEPVITVLGLYLVLLYSLLFTFLSGFDYIFKETYALSPGLTGSCFGAIAAGATAFALLAPGLYSWARHRTEHVKGAAVEPEFRLWPAIAAAPLLPGALLWLGWTNDAAVPVWCSLAACFVFGVVLISVYVSSYEYIVDSYGDHAAVALASVTMARYWVAGGMVMASRPMFEGAGVRWALTVLGCVAAVLAPAPLVFKLVGRRLRGKSAYAKG